MDYKRILTIQDISCVGQCSLTVALPIISACSVECSVLPSAVLSTHTTAFQGYTFRDLSDDMPSVKKHWEKEKIKFSAIYTGYLGSEKQADYVADIFESALKDGGEIFVDPAMADGGSLYPGFDENYVKAMTKLSQKADYVIPNITEASFMTGVPYKEEYDREYINLLMKKLTEAGCKNIILTGVSYEKGKTGIAILENGNHSYYEHEFLGSSCHGTGDIYASTFVGAKVRGKSAYDAAKIAADYTLECIKATMKLENHTYGAAFELAIPKLIQLLK